METTEATPLDLDMYTQTCFCGSEQWKIWVAWDNDGEIASFSKEMYCLNCDAKALTPPFDEE
jgi:hypothetical protein